MSGQKPNEFPIKNALDGSEEVYTQTGGTNNKFTISQVKDWFNALYNGEFNTLVDSTLISGSDTHSFVFGELFLYKTEAQNVDITGVQNVDITSSNEVSISATGTSISGTNMLILQTPDYTFKGKKSVLMLQDSLTGEVEYERIVDGGNTGKRPNPAYTYQIYYDTDLGRPIIWNGSKWKDFVGNDV